MCCQSVKQVQAVKVAATVITINYWLPTSMLDQLPYPLLTMMPPMLIYHFAATASSVGRQLQFLHVTFALCNFLHAYVSSCVFNQ